MPKDRSDEWATDSSTKTCTGCNSLFGVMTRRHHCRCCGEIYCEKCSGHQHLIPTLADKTKKRVCDQCHTVIAAIEADSSATEGNDSNRVFRFTIAIANDLNNELTARTYATKATNMLKHLESIKRQISRCASELPSTIEMGRDDADLDSAPSSPMAKEAPLVTANTFANANANESNVSLVLYDSAWEAERLGAKYEEENRHAIDLGHILQRVSLLAFFHRLYGVLLKLVLTHKVCGFADLPKSDHPTVTLNRKAPSQLSIFAPVMSKSFFDRFGDDNERGLCKKAAEELQKCAARITRRYEEQICCLTEDGAITLADSVFIRITAKAASVTPLQAGASAGSFLDFCFEAILKEAGADPVPLETRVADVDRGWTDHGALSLCGLRTYNEEYYDPDFTTDHTHIGQYYYRLGTKAEALALRLRPTGTTRHSVSPIRSISQQAEEFQRVMLDRDRLYATYALCRFASADERSWADTGSVKELSIAAKALQRLHDYLTSRTLFITYLNAQYDEATARITKIEAKTAQLQARIEDANKGSYLSLESEAHLTALQGAQSSDPSIKYKQVMITKYKRLLRTRNGGAIELYTHLRLKMTAVLLRSSFILLEGDVLLMGTAVQYDEKIGSLVNRIVSSAQANPICRFWSVADIVESHCETFSRAVAERYSEPMTRISESSVSIFAECLIARFLHLAAQDVDKASRIDVVRSLGAIELEHTMVQVKKVYLPLVSGTGAALCEAGIHTKTGILTSSGKRFAGAANAKKHHKAVKYGYILASEDEAKEKKLTLTDETWQVPDQVVAPKKKFSLMGMFAKQQAPAPPMIKQKPENDIHWPSSAVLAGPRLLAAGETVGVTAQIRTRKGEAATIAEKVMLRMITSNQGEIEAPEVYTNFVCTQAGFMVAAAVWNDKMLLANGVSVRPGPVDWSVRSTISVSPASTVAGEPMSAKIFLRDQYGNLTSSTSSDDFHVSVFNDVEVVPDAVEEGDDGGFVFSFTPVIHGPVRLTVSVGGSLIPFNEELNCEAARPDFKNSLLSFDEIEVAAGEEVHGNLLLRDVYGNRVFEDDEQPEVELINGGRRVLEVERVGGGEYIFSFSPTRHGTAIVRATSRKNSDSVIARLLVHTPHEMSWDNSVVSCINKVVYVGEKATFHITVKDQYGNSVTDGYRNDQFTVTAILLGTGEHIPVSEISGELPSLVFSCTPTKVGTVVGEAIFEGIHKQSQEVSVPPAVLSWANSQLIVESEAMVGEWIPVQIECRDAWDNPTPAHNSDFTVTVVCDNRVGRTKTVEGAGSCFGFQMLSTMSGLATATVTYAGRSSQTCQVRVMPGAPLWATSRLSCSTTEVVAGEPISFDLTFNDTYGNPTTKIDPNNVLLQIHADEVGEQGRTGTKSEADATPTPSNQSLANDSVGTRSSYFVAGPAEKIPPVTMSEVEPIGESTLRYHYKPTKVARLQIHASLSQPLPAPTTSSAAKGEPDNNDAKVSPDILVVPAILDWPACTLECNHSSGIAGHPIVATLTLLERFRNQAMPPPEELFALTVVSTGPDSPDPLDVPVTKTVTEAGNVLQFRFTPELAGEVKLVGEYKVEGEESKIFQCPIRSSDVDWKGKTKVTTQESCVAGESITATVQLLDAYGNPFALGELDASIFDAVITSSDGEKQPPTTVPLKAASEEASCNVLLLDFIPTAAGVTTIVLRCQEDERPPISVDIQPAVCHWPSCRLVWDDTSLIAGVEATATVQFLDQFGNTSSNELPKEELVALVEPEQKPSGEEGQVTTGFRVRGEGSTVLQLFSVPTVSVPFRLGATYNGETVHTQEATVIAAPVRGDNVVFDFTSDVGAGELTTTPVKLFDRFNNIACGIDSPSAFTFQAKRGGETITIESLKISPAESEADPNPTTATEWIASWTLETKGHYTIVLEICGAEKKIEFDVVAGPPAWPDKCELTVDEPNVGAGSTLMYSLALRDVFGNPTGRGFDPEAVKVIVQYDEAAAKEQPVPEAVHPTLVAMPQDGPGCYSFSTDPTFAGALSAKIVNQSDSTLNCSTTVNVVAGPMSWEKCQLQPVVPEAIVDQEFTVSLQFCDAFGNNIDIGEASEEVRSELKLIRAAATNNGSTLQGIFEISKGISSLPTKVGELVLSMSQAESSVQHSVTVKVNSAGVLSATATLVDPNPQAVAGEVFETTFTLSDKHGNPVAIDCDQLTGRGEIVPPASLDKGNVPVLVTIASVESGAGNTYVAKCEPTCIGAMSLVFESAIEDEATHAVKKLGEAESTVVCGPIHPSECRISCPESVQCFAGSQHTFVLTLADVCGNVVPALPTEGYELVTSNGTANPAITMQKTATDGKFQFTVTPVEIGKLLATLEVPGQGKTTSPTVEVGPAPMHWASCTIKLVEDSIKLGNETGLVITPKDTFGNPVPSPLENFTITAFNEGTEIEVDDIVQAKKGFIGSVKPMKRGKIYVLCKYLPDPDAEERKSNVATVI